MPILYHDIIICPDCGYLQDAPVTFEEGDPWPSYLKVCDRCGYIIIESEWQSVKATLALQNGGPQSPKPPPEPSPWDPFAALSPTSPVLYPISEDQPLQVKKGGDPHV